MMVRGTWRAGAPCSGVKWRTVPGLIDGQLSAIGEADRGKQPPALVRDVARHFDPFVAQFRERGVDVVAHEVELMPAVSVGRVHGQFGGRQREDEPAAARVGRRQAKHVREERSHLLGLWREHDRMNTVDHAVIL